MSDPFFLSRFTTAQDRVYARVLDELSRGKKKTHWMWFIFPQLTGLGVSDMAQYYGIASLEETRAYWANDLLRPRLIQCTRLVVDRPNPNPDYIFGHPDNLKFHSCMTLFALAIPNEPTFRLTLQKCFRGRKDDETIELLLVK